MKRSPRKKPTVSRLKKEADKAFSVFIRQRDRECYTCLKRMFWTNLQCGHFISRAKSATRYDEFNCRAQCMSCNIWRRGNLAEFAARLIQENGLIRFNELIQKGRTTKQFTVKELQRIIERYAVITWATLLLTKNALIAERESLIPEISIVRIVERKTKSLFLFIRENAGVYAIQ